MKINRILLIVFYLLGCVNVSFTQQREVQKNNDRIIYLDLKYINGEILLENYTVVKGKLKTSKVVTLIDDNIYCKVVNPSNDHLFESVFADPSDRNFEYVNEQGMLEMKKVKFDSLNFTIRIPYNESIDEVSFHKIHKDDNQINKNFYSENTSMGSFKLNLKNINEYE